MNILMLILSWIFKPTLNLATLFVIAIGMNMIMSGVPFPTVAITSFIGGFISGIIQYYFKNKD